MRETKVEQSHIDNVEDKGGLCLKWVSPNYVGVTDRIDLYGIDAAVNKTSRFVKGLLNQSRQPNEEEIKGFLRSALAEMIQFTETKRPKGPTETHQKRFHERMRKMGFTVNVLDHL